MVAAEGATYSAPDSIPYKFSMAGSVRGYHKVLSVTSKQDQLKVETQGDKSSMVNTLHKIFKGACLCVKVQMTKIYILVSSLQI